MNWILYALIGALMASLGSIFAKVGLLKNIDSNILTTVKGVVMAVAVIIFTLVLGTFNSDSFRAIDGRTWLYIILSGVCGALSWLLFYFALAHGPVAGVTAVDKLSIIITIVLATVFLSEKITPQIGLGALLIGVGTILVALPAETIKSFIKIL